MSMKHLSTMTLVALLSINLFAQSKPLNYYIPDIEYDKAIPTPEQFLGFQIGDWHVTHDQSLAYMRMLAEKSDRVEIEEYARSHEQRPLVVLKISSPSNLKNQEEIRTNHLKLADPSQSKSLNTANMPIVLYQGYSIHGNEPSGGNGALLVAYYLAAGKSKEVLDLLDNAFILLDPCYNPDGFTRFSTWANSHKGLNLITDPRSREYNEIWPGGRTNHYWFDLNRDWLLLVHPESRGRIKNFHKWLPNILTDHHEMGTNSTFFFQPGVNSRVNPNTHPQNQPLTEEIGTYHAKALDAIGSQYYTKKNFDDFYYGKGSTYPDIHGCVGILFEQASSRGHLQESENGLLSFAFTIRNQVATSFSTQKAAMAMRQKMLDYQRKFYVDMAEKAKASSIKAYIYSDPDANKIAKFNELLMAHQIQVEAVGKDASVKGNKYPAGQSFLVKTDQRQFGLVKTAFEKVTTFTDSLFYDVSAWTLPLAFDITYDEVTSELAGISSEKLDKANKPKGQVTGSNKPYAYIMDWEDQHAASALYELQNMGLVTKVSNIQIPFMTTDKLIIEKGTIIIPIENQPKSATEIKEAVASLANKYGISIHGMSTGMGDNLISLGDPEISKLTLPKVFTIIGLGTSSYDVGEVWHYLDQRLGLAMSMIDKKDLSRANFDRYNTLILADGNYSDIPEATLLKLDQWIRNGGRVIALKGSMDLFKAKSWINLKAITEGESGAKSDKMPSYENLEEIQGSKVIGGSIFSTKIDLSHPLGYGFPDAELPLFKEGSALHEIPSNIYSAPVRYSEKPLHSGYVPKGYTDKAKNTAVVTTHAQGNGKIIAMNDNVFFRGFWFGGFRLFNNALFFGETISSGSLAR